MGSEGTTGGLVPGFSSALVEGMIRRESGYRARQKPCNEEENSPFGEGEIPGIYQRGEGDSDEEQSSE